ncbi:hypothetical protein ACYAFX_00810 [Rhodococcus aetherivorans]
MTPGSTLRGAAAGALTAALAVAAHGGAGGGVPGNAAVALLLAVAAGVGLVAAHLRAVPTAVLLAAGQGATHLVLAAVTTGHLHASAPMLVAHTVAVVACAALLEAAQRLYGPLTRAVRAAWTAAPSHRGSPDGAAGRGGPDRRVGPAAPCISRRGRPSRRDRDPPHRREKPMNIPNTVAARRRQTPLVLARLAGLLGLARLAGLLGAVAAALLFAAARPPRTRSSSPAHPRRASRSRRAPSA